MNKLNPESASKTSAMRFVVDNRLKSFDSKVNRDGPLPDQAKPHYKGLENCWEWTSGKFSTGYGRLHAQTFALYAHRVSWVKYFGDIPEGMWVLHKCDNPSCVNPQHLFLGSHMDNVVDRETKGRSNPLKGERHISRTKPETIPRGDRHWARRNPEKVARGADASNAKLTLSDVKDIREKYSSGVFSHTNLANLYGVSRRAVGMLLAQKTWKEQIP